MKIFVKFFKLIGIKVLKFQKYLKLVNSEKNYIKNLEQTEKYKILIKELIIKSQSYKFKTLQIKSQNLQDLITLDLFGFKNNGIFIEAGACDGILNSNTYLLEKEFSWSGLLVEPLNDYFIELKKNRNVNCENYALYSNNSKDAKFLMTDLNDLSTLKGFETTDIHDENRKKNMEISVKTVTLAHLLDNLSFPNEIDFLSLDTEGSELEILKAFNFEKYIIKVICVEHNQNKNRKLIQEYLEQKKYIRIEFPIIDIDDFYIHNSFEPKNKYFEFNSFRKL